MKHKFYQGDIGEPNSQRGKTIVIPTIDREHNFVCAKSYLCVRMRIIAFILAMTVMVLSLMPCADLDEMRLAEQHRQEVAHQAPCRHDADPLRDLCSPFCHCTCCAAITVPHSVVKLPTPIHPQPETLVFTGYTQDRLLSVSLPVWQPPQLV